MGSCPATYDLSGVPVGVLFAPDHTPELEIMKQLLKGVLDPGQAAQDWAAPKWLKHPNIELYVHDENIFVMGSTHKEVEAIQVQANASRQLAVHLKQEIQRIISLSKPYDPAA